MSFRRHISSLSGQHMVRLIEEDAVTPEIVGSALNEFRRHLLQPACPSCGDTLMAAAGAELAARGYIRNSWVCDSCGHDFVTAVRLAAETGILDDAGEP